MLIITPEMDGAREKLVSCMLDAHLVIMPY